MVSYYRYPEHVYIFSLGLPALIAKPNAFVFPNASIYILQSNTVPYLAASIADKLEMQNYA